MLAASVAQGTQPSDSIEALLWRGIDAMYSYRFEEAAQSLEEVMQRSPENPVAPFIAVANAWLRAMTEEGIRESHQALLASIDAAIPKYNAMLASQPDRAVALLYLGSTYGLKARVALSGKRWGTVVTAGLKGWRMVNRANSIDSTMMDAYLPIGIFDYYTGASSAPIRFMARLFGMNPDKEAGIEKLHRATEEAPYAWIEAASTLAILLLYIEDKPERALQYVERLVEKYPDNYYFNFLKEDALVRTGKYAAARQYLPELATLLETAHPNQKLEWELKFANVEASLALADRDQEQALERATWVIDNYAMEFDWHLGFALMTRGTVREQGGDFGGARRDYKRARALDNRTYVIVESKIALDRLEGRK